LKKLKGLAYAPDDNSSSGRRLLATKRVAFPALFRKIKKMEIDAVRFQELKE